MYAIQAMPRTDAEIGKDGPFWTETKLSRSSLDREPFEYRHDHQC